MRITPYDLKKVDNLDFYKRSKLQKIMEEFLQGESDCVKVEGWINKTAASCASSFNVSAKRYRMTGLKAISRNGEVFLIKTSAIK